MVTDLTVLDLGGSLCPSVSRGKHGSNFFTASTSRGRRAGSAHPGGSGICGGLAGLDDRELLGMVRSLAGGSGSRAAACGLLVSRHRNLVCSCVQRYRGGTGVAPL